MALFVVLLLGTALRAAARRYESSPVLKASQILPRELVSGLNHRVEERVINDGYQNHYKIYSKFGEYAVVSTAMLRKRVHEIHEMAAIGGIGGAIGGDAGKGAAIGAATGALIGGMRRRDQVRRQEQKRRQWEQQQVAQYQ